MAVTAVISETCDLCRDGILFPEGRTKSVAFAYRGLAYDLDLCNDHYKQVTDFFRTLIQAGEDRRFDQDRRRKVFASGSADASEKVVDWILGSGLPRLRPDRDDVLAAYQQAEESLR